MGLENNMHEMYGINLKIFIRTENYEQLNKQWSMDTAASFIYNKQKATEITLERSDKNMK